MDPKQLIPAQLDEQALHKLQDFEQTLHDTTGHDVIIIAYQGNDQQDNNQS